jgi:hypothetical protein
MTIEKFDKKLKEAVIAILAFAYSYLYHVLEYTVITLKKLFILILYIIYIIIPIFHPKKLE